MIVFLYLVILTVTTDRSAAGESRAGSEGTSLGLASSVTTSPVGLSPRSHVRPVALVFRGADTSCCAEEMAALIRSHPRLDFEVVFTGGSGDPGVVEALEIPGVRLYAQPGGDGEDYQESYRRGYGGSPGARDAVRRFVRNGGRYLGICMGAYFTAPDALGLFPGRLDHYPASVGASVDDEADVVIPILWEGNRRRMFYQGGPSMTPRPEAEVRVVARYTNGLVAACLSSFGRGRIAIVGPHPEAPRTWFVENGLPVVRSSHDLGHRLIDQVMAAGAPGDP